eukprot:TRINITY_DN2619_c0_g1_i2.p1 TRINITY_DN2619_c0_g1~~TRINITY_DN2619_c0_g1_i2.p1  ORF type:complete len:168 (-),score=36.26 TRINITY_DN2619_c0_g1_i2:423-926(-)
MSESSPYKHDILKGSIALITGGGSGICFGIAKEFGRHGAKVAIMGRRQNVLSSACDEMKKEGILAIGIPGDVRKFEDCKKAVEEVVKQFGKLDILVNGAAGNFICSAEDLSINAFRTVIEIDLIGSFNMAKASFEALKKSRGHIINITATLHYKAVPYQIHASAAKV